MVARPLTYALVAVAAAVALVPAAAWAWPSDGIVAAGLAPSAAGRLSSDGAAWRARVARPFTIVEVLPPQRKRFTIRRVTPPEGDFKIIEVVPPKPR